MTGLTGALVIGLATGLVSAILFAQASTGTALGLFVLFFLSPLPVAIAGLGWGTRAAAVAALTAALAIAVIGIPRAAIFHALALGAPTAVLSYLLLLSRETSTPAGSPAINGSGPAVEWYPLGRVITIAALWAGVLSVLAVWSTADDLEGLRTEIRAIIQRMIGAGLPVPAGQSTSQTGGPAGQSLGEAEISALTDLMAATMPGVLASAWMTVATLNLWLAGLVTRASGRLTRPWPDFSTLTLPKGFPLLFAASIAATFLPGFTGLLATGFAAALFYAYVLVGLAIIHYTTRGLSLRPMILAAVYMALIFLNPLSGLVVALIGIGEPVSPLRRRYPNPKQPNNFQ